MGFFQNRIKVSYFHILLIILVGIIIYSNAVNGKFIWDDYGLVKDNDYIKNWSNFPKIMTQDFGAGGGNKSNFYRPLQMIIHMVGYSLWGLNVKGYHFTSILLHILAAAALYFFLSYLVRDTIISFLASLLFVTHPINTEAVYYISGVGDPLSLLFILLSLVFYIKSYYFSRTVLYILALLSFTLALLSKENAIVLPILILLYHYTSRKPIEIKKFTPFLIFLTSYILLRLTVLAPFMHPEISFASLSQRILAFFAAISEYLRLLLLPFDLHAEYGNKLFKLTDVRVISGLLLSFSLFVIAFFKRKNDTLSTFSIVWFFVTLLPVSNIYPINDSFMMEHWLYLPAIGFFIIFANTLIKLYKFRKLRPVTIILIIFILSFYSFLTIGQASHWKEPILFYKRNLKFTPNSWRFLNELGIEYANIGDFQKAINCYRKALEITPDLIGVYNNLGNAYKNLGRDKEAQASYSKAQEITFRLFLRYYEIGNKYKDAGRNRAAIASYMKALDFNPYNLALYNELASIYVILGSYNKAVKLLERALEIKPDFALTHNNLAVAYYYTKQYSLAIKHVDKATELGYKVEPKFLEWLKPYRR